MNFYKNGLVTYFTYLTQKKNSNEITVPFICSEKKKETLSTCRSRLPFKLRQLYNDSLCCPVETNIAL